MATSFRPHVHQSFESPSDSFTHSHTTKVSSASNMSEAVEHSLFQSASKASWPESTSMTGSGQTTLTDLVRSLPPQNSAGMALSQIAGTDNESLLEWIRGERMRKLPPEGSAYDKVLICARLFVERLQSFHVAVGHIAQETESHMAAQLVFVHCAGLLSLGEENAPALLDLFAFFYRCSISLDNLLSRTELFSVSQGIKDQVVLALADLVTLVVGVATHFSKHLGNTRSGYSLSVDIHSTFKGPIESFRARCEHVAELMWRHQLRKEGVEGTVADIKTIREWLEPEDPVVTHINKFTAQFAQEREESTCLWVTPYLTRFLKGQQSTLTIAGVPGSGKSVLATVINDHLQHPIGGVSYMPLFVPINSRVLAQTTPVAIAKSILSQVFVSRIGNVGLYKILSETYERCRKIVNEDQYEELLWAALETALPASLKGAKETVLIVDGVDEATCGQAALLQRLQTAAGGIRNLKLIVLCATGKEKQAVSDKSTVHITPGLIFDDVAAVVKRVFKNAAPFNELPVEEAEMLVNRIVKASDGSFLWAKLAAKKVRDESPSNGQAFVKAVDSLVASNQTVNDLVTSKLKSNLHPDAVKVLGWLATAARPLSTTEISSLLSVQVDKGTVLERVDDPLTVLKPLASLIFSQNNMLYLRHGQIRSAIIDNLPGDKGQGIKSVQVDMIRRMSVYLRHTVPGREELSLEPLDSHLTSSLLERHALLDFVLRYWHGTTAVVYGTTDADIANAKKDIGHVFATSPLIPLLEMAVWKNKSTPVLALLHSLRSRLYQQTLGNKHPASVQVILGQAGFYRTIEDVQPLDASRVYYTAVTMCQQVLSAQHVITMRMAQHFLEFTSTQVTTTKTELMQRRTEVLRVLVECYKIHYGSTSEVVTTTLRALAEHYTAIQESHKAREINVSLQGEKTETAETTGSRRASDESLVVQLRGPKGVKESGTALTLDDIAHDKAIAAVNVDTLLKEAKMTHQSTFAEAQHAERKSVSENGIMEMLSAESMDYTSIARTTASLVQSFFTQHRWTDAARTIKRSLRALWPSFFAPSIHDVVLPSKEVQSCLTLAQRLRDCHRYRRRGSKEEDVCERLYHALRRDRPAGDTTLRSVTLDLVRLYERTRQTDKLLSIHHEILEDYTKNFGRTHPIVLQELWTLAELTKPKSAAVPYYRRLFELLNKSSDTCKPEAFEPLLVVVTELINQEECTEALGFARILFNTLQVPNVSPKLRDPGFVQSVYEAYVYALRKTHADYTTIHDVTVRYRKACLAVFGSNAAITISATKTLAYISQESKQYESEAVELFQSLLATQSDDVDIDYDDIRATLEAISEDQASFVGASETGASQNSERAISTRRQRLTSAREEYGWAHESTLSQMEELVSLYSRRSETRAATSLLHETAVHVLSSESSSSGVIAAAKSIASSYKSVGQVQRANELGSDIYTQVVAKDTKVKSGLSIKSTQQSLLFLAQLEYGIRGDSSVTPNEVYAALMAEVQYFERFRKETQSKSSTLESTLDVVLPLQALLSVGGRSTAASCVFQQWTDFFMARQGQLKLQRGQAELFLSTILKYFENHQSRNFLRSIALACYNSVEELLSKGQDSQRACDLALASFRYVDAHDGLSHPSTMKLLFKTALSLSSHTISSKAQKTQSGQQALSVSATILSPILSSCKANSLDLSSLSPAHLNTIIKLLDSQKSYKDLAWLLTSLWEKRQSASSSSSAQPQGNGTYTLALGRMLVMTRYLIGEYTSAIRLAEDILYNTARVHGARHPSTAELTVLLSQMYTSVAQGYQDKPAHRELAAQYYRKAAGLHENALRVFIDPDTDSVDEVSPPSSPGAGSDTETGKAVRQHLHLLKLAVERLGSWPKEYAEYEHLSADLFQRFRDDLKGEKGVENWNLKQFGSGKAEASDDLVPDGGIDKGMIAIAV
ncbi:NACHT domain protein [Aspergillus unguis]